MTGIREVLASNLKEYRRKGGLSQDRLAELAGISSQYLATVETCRKFPTPEVLDRLAGALGIGTHKLFELSATPEEVLERLHQSIVADVKQGITDMKQTVAEAIEKKLGEKCGVKDGP